MRGKLFVCLYSILLIGLFGACCYLMTTVNPPRLSENVTRRFHAGNNIYPRVPHLPRENPDYGLEKIPEGVDAEEFRRHLMQRLIKYDSETEKPSYESVQRVVPPVWPSDNIAEKKAVKPKSKESNIRVNALKGHRRSVIDNKLHDIKEGSGSIILKVVDNSGHKKIEIKFISGENIKSSYSSQLRSNASQKEWSEVYHNAHNNNYDEGNDNVIKIKADDIILLNIVDDSDIIVEKNILSGVNNTDDTKELVMNISDVNYINKTWINQTKSVNVMDAEKKSKELINNGVYTFSLLFNGENRTIDSKIFSTQEYNSDSFTLAKMLSYLNHTNVSTESMPPTTTDSINL